MSSDRENIIYLAITLGFSFGAVLCFFYQQYIAQIKTSKEINKVNDCVIPSEISTLISRLRMSVSMRVANVPDAIPSAVVFFQRPSYIIISKLFLDNSQFELRHLLALIAHEAGHIKKSNKSTWGIILSASGWLAALIVALVSLSTFNWTYFLYSLLAATFFTILFIISSWVDEYSADSFAIKDASIPVEDLAEVLIALKYRYKRTFYKKITHPPVSYRVRRIRQLYGT